MLTAPEAGDEAYLEWLIESDGMVRFCDAVDLTKTQLNEEQSSAK